MFQTPIGGIALITNILILIIGSVINMVKGKKSYTAIISQKHILAMESTKIGSIIASLLAIFMPLLIFTAVGGFSITSLYALYNDAEKVTIIDIAKKSVSMTIREYRVLTSYAEESTEKSPHDKKNSGRVLSGSTTTEQLYSVDFFLAVDEAFNQMVKQLVDKGPKASTTFFLFSKAQDEKKLIPFLEKNGLHTNLEARKTMALFFGIEAYNGTERQNNLLRKKLGELTSNQLTQMSKAIIK